MKNKIAFHARQGDVLIERVNALPTDRKLRKRANDGRVILAAGEVTGHHHAIADEHVSLFETAAEAGVTYLEVREAMAALQHDEHATIELPPGKYRVSIQKEYSPGAIRNVSD